MIPRRATSLLVSRICDHKEEIKTLLEEQNGDTEIHEGIYRFYHHSYKVYYLQNRIKKILKLIQKIAGKDFGLNPMFLEIVNDALSRNFSMEDNKDWLNATSPLCTAYFHAYYFLIALNMVADNINPEQADKICLIPYYFGSALCLFSSR